MDMRSFNGGSSTYGFSVDNQKIADSLRQLADSIDQGKVIPQSVRVFANAKINDYTITALRISFAETVEQVAEQLLYSAKHDFPIDVQK